MQTATAKIDALTVLVIEDNRDDAEILENHLLQIANKKLTIVFEQSLKKGLSRLSQGDIDFIFLDLTLPDSEGLKALTKLRHLAPLIPIIVLTGHDDYDLSLQSLKLGAQEYLLKRELGASALERLIDYARLRQQSSQVAGFLTSLVQSSVDAIIGRSLDGKIISWNSGAEKMYGYTETEVIGKPLDFIVPEDDRSSLPAILEKTRRGLAIDFEAVRVRKDGSRFSVACSVSPVRNPEGMVIGGVIVARDITSRLLAEKELKESTQRLQLAVKSANVGVWSWDTRAGALIWDDRMFEFFGKSREDYPQRPNEFSDVSLDTFLQSVHPEDLAKVDAALKNVLDHNSDYECSYRIIWSDSSLHYIEARGVLCFDVHGERTNMIGVCIDVTQRKTMERSLREINKRREQIASAVVQHAPVGIVTMDSDLGVTDVNQAFATMSQRQRQDLLLQPLGRLVPREIFSKAQESIKTGSAFQMFRYKIDLPGNSFEHPHFWDLSFWPVLSSVGVTNGAILQVIDCSEMVMLEEQREDFIAAVAHDIKNPLIGASHVLNHLCSQPADKFDPRSHEMLVMLKDSNSGLLGLVQNLVDVHQYEKLGYPVTSQQVNLADTITSCIKQTEYFSDSNEVTVNLKEMSRPVIISADVRGLTRVFMNLLHNAVKFSKSGDAVDIAINTIDSANVEVTFSDTGSGISEQDQKKLFQRYGQGEAGKRKARGTGLGLYLSRQIVQAHNGQIGCKSEVGAGSTFFVRLPVIHKQQDNPCMQTTTP